MKKMLFTFFAAATISVGLFCQEDEQLEVLKELIRSRAEWFDKLEQKLVIEDQQGQRSYRCFVIASLATLLSAYSAEKIRSWYLYYRVINPAAVFTNFVALMLIMRELKNVEIDEQRILRRTEEREELYEKIQFIEQYLATQKRSKDVINTAPKLATQPQE